MSMNAGRLSAVARLLEYLDQLALGEGLLVSGCVETEDQRLFFVADEDGLHGISGAGPR